MRRIRLRLVVRSNQWPTVLVQWLAAIQLDTGEQLELSVVDAAAEVVETLHSRRPGLRGSLRRLGNALGEIGWSLEQVNTWIAELRTLTGHRQRAELRSFESYAALAEGWAERYVSGPHTGACIDPVTSIGTPAVLRLRLGEIYQHCRAFHITPTDAYCFVVIDANTDDLAPFERDAVMITTAGVVGNVFRQGETVVRHRNRLIVLASNSDSTRHRAQELNEALQAAPICRSANPTVWADELPASKIDIDRHLVALVG